MIQAAAEKTAQKMVQPRAAKIDATGEFPKDLVETFGKQGYLSLLLPESYGGTEGDVTSFCLVVEEIARVSGSCALIILAQGLGSLPVLLGGNPSQKELCFSEVSEKNSLIAFALREPEGGREASFIKTTAEKKGGDYLINGRKSFVTHGSIAKFYSVFASTRSESGGEGVSVFLVEDGTAGLRYGKPEGTLGMRGSVMADLLFENCRIPEKNRLGEEGEGWKIAMKAFTRSRPGMGAQAVGIAQGALDFAIRYANERIQFGKPIASFEAIQFMIADMATQVEAARSLVYKAAAQMDENREDVEKLSAISKWFASQIAMRVTTDAVQILGGYGYMKDYPVERMMRDAKVAQVYEEPDQILRWVVAQELLKGLPKD